MKKVFRKNNKGFSLLESVISILLVSIIMTAVLSTVLYTNSVTKKAEVKMYAINEIDNIIACYKTDNYSYYGMKQFDKNQELKFTKDFELIDSEYYFYKIVLNVGVSSINATAYNKEDKIIYQMDDPYVLGVAK